MFQIVVESYIDKFLSISGSNSGIDLELDLIPSLIPGIGMGIDFQGIGIELKLLKNRWN